MNKSVTHDVLVSLLSLYDSYEDKNRKIIYDTDEFTPYSLVSSLRNPFLIGYSKCVMDSYLQFLATSKKIDVDYMFRVPEDRLKHIKNGDTVPCHIISNIVKTQKELTDYIAKIKNSREYTCITNSDSSFLHIPNHLCIYKNTIYLPEFVILDYAEKEKGIFFPNVKYDTEESNYTIMVGYLMKKYKELHLK